MKKIVILPFLFGFVMSTFAQNQSTLQGDWKGYINIKGQKLGIETHFNKFKRAFSGTIDIPKQGVSAAHLEKVQFIKPDSVFWSLNAGPSGILQFNGILATDSTINGKFSQRGYTFPFQLHKEKTQRKKSTFKAVLNGFRNYTCTQD